MIAEEVATDAGECSDDAFVFVAVGGVDVDGVLNLDVAGWHFEVGERVGEHSGECKSPTVDDSLEEEFLLESQAFMSGEASMGIVEVRQVFLVAGEAVEGGGEDVEGEASSLIVDREESDSVVEGEWARVLVIDARFEEQVARADKGGVADFLGAVREFGTLMRIEEVVVSRNLEIQTQDMFEYHVKSVS